jgi:hypothetical protein
MSSGAVVTGLAEGSGSGAKFVKGGTTAVVPATGAAGVSIACGEADRADVGSEVPTDWATANPVSRRNDNIPMMAPLRK